MNWTELIGMANFVLLIVILKGIFILGAACDRIEAQGRR